jgi:hypothetical protein
MVNFPFWADVLLKSRYPPYTSFKFKFMQAILGPSKLKGKSNPNPPALTDPLDFKRLLDPSSTGWLAKIPVKLSLMALLFAFYCSRRQDSLGQKGLFNSIKKVQDQVKQFISS